MSLEDPVGRLESVGAELMAASAALRAADPGPDAFGCGAVGRLGDLGGALHRICAAALDARAREAVAYGDRLSDTADSVARAAERYAAADDAAARKIRSPATDRPGVAAGATGWFGVADGAVGRGDAR
ncbi:MAG: hypothetical protein QOI74_2269 [Micromonosporaceae bacterium]|jgi:hypothetical protein|nr:hypothetical protein [Micromonosporaceae bacterium]